MSNFNTTEAAICLMQAMFPEDLLSFSLFDLTDESELLTGKKDVVLVCMGSCHETII